MPALHPYQLDPTDLVHGQEIDAISLREARRADPLLGLELLAVGVTGGATVVDHPVSSVVYDEVDYSDVIDFFD